LTLALTFTLALSPSPTPSLAKQQHQLPTLTPTPNSTPIPAQPSPSPHPTRLQVGGLCALLTHASLTPYLSGVPWRHRAAQGLSALTAASSLAYGAHALPTTLPTTLPTLPTTRLATPPPLPPAPTDLPPSAHPKRRARTRTRKQPLTLSRLCYCPLGMLGERYASAALVLPALGFVATACGLGVVNVMVPHRLIAAAPPHHCTSAPLHPLAPPCTPCTPLHPLHPLSLCRWRCSRVPSPRRP